MQRIGENDGHGYETSKYTTKSNRHHDVITAMSCNSPGELYRNGTCSDFLGRLINEKSEPAGRRLTTKNFQGNFRMSKAQVKRRVTFLGLREEVDKRRRSIHLLSIGQYPSTVLDNGPSRRILMNQLFGNFQHIKHFMWTPLDI
ncbi:hypothetical protein CI102_2496 [Trichoderma harzianum]|nr:hypothetical protein CI102_2496 [Trichoderma harzianum]